MAQITVLEFPGKIKEIWKWYLEIEEFSFKIW